MAQFDAAKTVNNILSGNGETAQEPIRTVVRTATDLANLPTIDVARLPGVGDALKAASDVGEKLGGALRGGAKRQAAPKPSKQVQQSPINPFNVGAMHRPVVLAAKLMEIADRKDDPDDGLADAIGALGSFGEMAGGVSGLAGDLVRNLTAEVGEITEAIGEDALGLMGLRQQALTLFVTHYPRAREKFKMEPLEQRQPDLVSRSNARATPPEDRLSFWREDAQLNAHHGHWHEVNPLGGRPVAGSNIPDMGDRHGELFVYMHEQMLARYDAERLGVELSRVRPFDDYDAPIPEGYDPGDLRVWDGQQWVGFSARPANATLRDLNLQLALAPTLEDMERFREALRAAARQGRYELIQEPNAVTSDNFANTMESNIESVDFPNKEEPLAPENGTNYGNLHGDGHTYFARFDFDPNQTAQLTGVMANLDATVRDPVFWRWHKHVDTIIQLWRETLGRQEPHNFAEGVSVTVRSEDIILCGEKGIPGKEGLPADFDEERLGAAAFGYSEDENLNRWDDDFSSGETTFTVVLDKKNNKTVTKTITTTDELHTEMRTRTIQVHDPSGGKSVQNGKKVSEEIDYLSHEDFFYFIRLQNRLDRPQTVTIRIFLAPERWVDGNTAVDDNTAWIEMDRFLHRLAADERAVVFRRATLSAVIRKPAIGHEVLEGAEQRPSEDAWCDCGWPYTLLLPRGTKEGLDFRLLVMVSGNEPAMTGTDADCTSMSYCGLKDREYPDERPMGYPFDRPLTDSIDSIVEKHENWASRRIRIRCRNL